MRIEAVSHRSRRAIATSAITAALAATSLSAAITSSALTAAFANRRRCRRRTA